MLRSIPMIGANDELFTNVPFSRRSVAGLEARKPRLHSSDLKVSVVVAPGASGLSNW